MSWQQTTIPDAERHGDIQRILERCVAHTTLASAFFVRAHSHRRNAPLSIVACFPGDCHQTAFPRRVSGLIRRALDSQHPQVVITGTADHKAVARDAQVVMAVPVAWQHCRPDGVIVATSPASDSSGQVLDFLQEEARQLAEVLAANLHPSPTSDFWKPGQHSGTEHAALPCTPTRDAWVHELRVPLSAARFALESLWHVSADDPAQSCMDAVQTALLGIAQAQSIVRWFSQLREIEQGDFRLDLRPVVVAEVIQRALVLLPGSSERTIITIDQDVGPLVADPLWLTQALTNLFENATKHARSFDPIRVAVCAVANDRAIISVRTPGGPETEDDSQPLLCHQPQCGRADDLTSRGIGLALVRFFITEMGGEFWAEADAHDGTTVVLSLPVAEVRTTTTTPRRVRPMRCPQCGAETPNEDWNCISCRVNLYWAHQHYDELARIRTGQGLESTSNTPAFLIEASKTELSERAKHGGSAENKVRHIARRVIRGESGESP